MPNPSFLASLLSLPDLYYPKLSPDGRWVAWTWYKAGPAADVYAARTDGAEPPVRLTDSPSDTVLVNWAPDSQSVIVAEDQNGNERQRLFRIKLDQPLVMSRLTEDEPYYYVRGGQLHPNGRWLVYGANFDVATQKEIEPTWIYRHDLETGERFVLARLAKGGLVFPELSPTGEHVLYTRVEHHPAGRQIWIVDIEGTHDHEIINAGAARKVWARWAPDGRRVVVLAETETHVRLGLWERAAGSMRWLIDDPARNFEHAYWPAESDRIVALETHAARVRATLVDPETGDELRLPPLPGNLIPIGINEEGAWVGEYYSSRQPSDLVRFWLSDLQPESFTSLTRVWERTALREADLAQAEDFHWTSVDGLQIQGWLYRPADKARGTIVFVHGGPTAHSKDRINAQIQYYITAGFNVLDPNYRGSTGFGLTFREAIKVDGWGGREQEDIRKGIEALIAAGIAERGKVGITGTSYGGYSAWCAITRYPTDLIAAAAPICGMTDLVIDYETTRPDLRPYSEEMLGGSPTQVLQRYFERSPINFLKQITGQVLIVQGLRDPNVTPENVRVVTGGLQQAGIEYQLLTFDDEGHGISKPKNQAVLYERLVQFFAEAFTPDMITPR